MFYFDMLAEKEREEDDSGMRQSIMRSTAIDKVIERKCFICNSLQPPYVYHCDKCGRCVVMMDHHCRWVNNCVGLYTQKLFLLFLFYAIITFTYSIVLITTQFYDALAITISTQSINFTTSLATFTLSMLIGGLMFTLVVFLD
jgi:hypothetical protein